MMLQNDVSVIITAPKPAALLSRAESQGKTVANAATASSSQSSLNVNDIVSLSPTAQQLLKASEQKVSSSTITETDLDLQKAENILTQQLSVLLAARSGGYPLGNQITEDFSLSINAMIDDLSSYLGIIKGAHIDNVPAISISDIEILIARAQSSIDYATRFLSSSRWSPFRNDPSTVH